MPKISLLLYVHNVQNILPQCLNSLLKQNEKDFELLVFDNASSDGTFPILETYQKRDKRIKIFNSTEEENVSMIKNHLLQKAKGEILAFLPLMVFKEDFLQYAERKMNAGKYDVLIINDKKTALPKCPDGIYECAEEKNVLLTHQLARVNNIFYRREFLKAKKINFTNAEFGADFALYVKSIAAAEKICCSSIDIIARKTAIKTEFNLCNNKQKLLTKKTIFSDWKQNINRTEFIMRELQNYQQFAEVLQECEKFLRQQNLWNSAEISYIESVYLYVRTLSAKVPYPFKSFWLKFLAENFSNMVDIYKYERKSYHLPQIFEWLHYLKTNKYPPENFAQDRRIVTMVTAAEDNMDAMKTDVLLQSVIQNADEQNFYDIYVLHRGNIADYVREAIIKESSKNVFISFVNVEDYLPKDVNISIYKTSSLYFFISDILPFAEKVIFLKNNTLALKDIAKLAKIDMQNQPLSGVRDYADSSHIENELKLMVETYINDSVLLIDVPLCREIKLSEAFVKQIAFSEKIYVAQDVLNLVCERKINLIGPIYNCNSEVLSGARIIKNYPYDLGKVAILNYRYNPRKYLFGEFSEIWWKYARLSTFYEWMISKPKSGITDREYILMKKYIKEFICGIISFGDKAKVHKKNLIYIRALIESCRRGVNEEDDTDCLCYSSGI